MVKHVMEMLNTDEGRSSASDEEAGELGHPSFSVTDLNELLNSYNWHNPPPSDFSSELTMPSPPPSSDLGFEVGRGGAADQIPILVQDARRITTLTPALATVMTTHKQLILSVFDRQISIIKSRSQALEDAQVTVYDKALLILTFNGTNLEAPPALLFWCEHYLGIDDARGHFETPRVLQEMMAVPTVLNQGKQQAQSPHPRNRATALSILTRCLPLVPSTARESTEAASHRFSGSTVQSESQPREPVEFSADSQNPKVKRLFTVYDQARTEYMSLVDAGDSKSLTAAKFLRDTAENALTYLKEMKVDGEVLSELKSTCDMAAAAVVSLSGGKKRKFDSGQEGKDNTATATGAGSKGDDKRGKYGGRGRGGRGGRGGGADRARGGSGVPYGYTRPVDSYYPY